MNTHIPSHTWHTLFSEGAGASPASRGQRQPPVGIAMSLAERALDRVVLGTRGTGVRLGKGGQRFS